ALGLLLIKASVGILSWRLRKSTACGVEWHSPVAVAGRISVNPAGSNGIAVSKRHEMPLVGTGCEMLPRVSPLPWSPTLYLRYNRTWKSWICLRERTWDFPRTGCPRERTPPMGPMRAGPPFSRICLGSWKRSTRKPPRQIGGPTTLTGTLNCTIGRKRLYTLESLEGPKQSSLAGVERQRVLLPA